MSQSDFKFIFSNRSEVGLVDVYDLSEIFTSDQRFALSNLALDPDGLDQIFKLSADGLTKEDIRTMGDLETRVIDSLAISQETLTRVSFDLSTYVTTDKAIGEPGKHSFSNDSSSDNIIVFNGGIAAKKIEYNFLDETGELRTTTVPTSRESLFSSQRNNLDQYTKVFYPGLFRIRRRSHLYQLNLSSKLLIPKTIVVESPTDRLRLPVYMRTINTQSPSLTLLDCYTTKNSPIVLPVKIFNTASVVFARDVGGPTAFVFGWELRRQSDNAFVRGASINSVNIAQVRIDINVAGTVGNGTDCLLYVYLDPSAIQTLNLSGIGLTEITGGQDIGLVGFTSLKNLILNNNQLSTLPVWLKTLHDTLETLNIRDNAYWNNGIVSHFDYQSLSGASISGANTSIGTPQITLTQVLGYSGASDVGAIASYDGSYATVVDKEDKVYRDQRKNSILEETALLPTVNFANGFRPFTKLFELNLGPTVRLVNPDFSKIFPALRQLTIDRPSDSSPQTYWGLIPKMNNNGGLMSLNLFGHQGQLGGSIKYLGDTLEWRDDLSTAQKAQFIGQFKFSSINFDCRINASFTGGICTDSSGVPNVSIDGKPKYHHMATGEGVVATLASAWSGWLAELQSIDIRRNDIAFRIASGASLNWAKLQRMDNHWCGEYGSSNKVEYNASVSSGEVAVDILTAPQLIDIQAWRSGWHGKLFSITGARNLGVLNIGNNDWVGYAGADGEQYLLPSNFAVNAAPGNLNNLQFFYSHWLLGASNKRLEFRETDLRNLPRMRDFYLVGGYYVGKFPIIYTDSLSSSFTFNTWIERCRFRDVSSLGSDVTSRVGIIYAPNQGSEVGGCLTPNFKTLSPNDRLSYINFNSSLSSFYPGNWSVVSLRNKVIVSIVPGQTSETTTPGVTWTSRNNSNTSDAFSDKLYHSSPGAYAPSSQIMVGDIVSGTNVPTGTRVTQVGVDGLHIYINTALSLSGTSLSFTRAGQDISDQYNNHLNLDQLYLNNFRLIGSMPNFVNCTRLRIANLGQNLLTTYNLGTFKNITGVTNGLRTTPILRNFTLTRNAFTVQSIRNIISDLHDIAVYYAQRGIRPSIEVNALETRLNTATNNYETYTREQIFTERSTTTNSAGETVIIPDPLEIKFNQLGPGRLYPGITLRLF